MAGYSGKRIALALLVSAVMAGLAARAQATPVLLLDFRATGYNPTTGVWADSSGNADNATAAGTSFPTLAANQTPNGSSAVVFTSGQFLNLASTVADNGTGFTVFAFEETNGDANPKTIISTGGSGNGLQYRISGDADGDVQEVLRQGQANLGHSNTTLGTTFHSINVAANSSGAAFRTDGSNDGTAAGSSFTAAPLSTIGSANGGEFYVGEIAELRVYQGVLAQSDIQSVESAFTASYVTPTPEPAATALLGASSLLLLARRRACSI